MMDSMFQFMAVLVVVLMIIIAVMVFITIKLRDKIRQLTLALNTNIDKFEKSKKLSRSVIKGQVSEQIFPLAVDCPFILSDMKFLGAPIDYIVFNGLSEGKVTSIEIVDIKTGSSRLSPIQKSIKAALDNSAIAWRTITVKES